MTITMTTSGILDDEFGVLFEEMMNTAKAKIDYMSLNQLKELLKQINRVDDKVDWYASYRIAPYIKPYVVSAIRYKERI